MSPAVSTAPQMSGRLRPSGYKCRHFRHPPTLEGRLTTISLANSIPVVRKSIFVTASLLNPRRPQ